MRHDPEVLSKKSDSNKKRKVQQGLDGFLKPTGDINPKDHQAHQDLMTTLFLLNSALGFDLVERESFRKMIASHNKKYTKLMSNKKVQKTTINVDDVIREAQILTMIDQTICLTLDHCTSRAKS